MNNENFFKNNQLVVSYELLQLLRWIVTCEPEALRMLVQQALDSNCIDFDTQANHFHGQEMVPSHEDLQQHIIHFFDLLESTLQEAVSAESIHPHHDQPFLPSLNHIDSTLCGENTIALSVAQASNQLVCSTKQSAQEMFYKELLKNWRPRSRDHVQ